MWFANQPVRHKLFVPGNHDLPFDTDPEYAARYYILYGITFIETGNVMLGGVHFYVLPARPWMHDALRPWVFNRRYMPHGVDALVTHGAPQGILDSGGRWGCAILRDLVHRTNPKNHIFGHCHENGGQNAAVGMTDFYNVAVKDF
jgi:Icc-related predicted phosphoesterase